MAANLSIKNGVVEMLCDARTWLDLCPGWVPERPHVCISNSLAGLIAEARKVRNWIAALDHCVEGDFEIARELGKAIGKGELAL